MLSIGVDLQRVSKTRRACELETAHDRSALAAIDVEPIHDNLGLRGVQSLQRRPGRFIAAVVNDENRKFKIAQTLHERANLFVVVVARNDRATLKHHEGANLICPDEHAPPSSL